MLPYNQPMLNVSTMLSKRKSLVYLLSILTKKHTFIVLKMNHLSIQQDQQVIFELGWIKIIRVPKQSTTIAYRLV